MLYGGDMQIVDLEWLEESWWQWKFFEKCGGFNGMMGKYPWWCPQATGWVETLDVFNQPAKDEFYVDYQSDDTLW